MLQNQSGLPHFWSVQVLHVQGVPLSPTWTCINPLCSHGWRYELVALFRMVCSNKELSLPSVDRIHMLIPRLK